MPAKLTDNDRKILALAWHCFDTQPKVNYKKLAEIGNYKNPSSAAACFSAAKKKLLNSGVGADAGSDASPDVAAKAPSKKRARKLVSPPPPPPRAPLDKDGSQDGEDAHEPPKVKIKLEPVDLLEENSESQSAKRTGAGDNSDEDQI